MSKFVCISFIAISAIMLRESKASANEEESTHRIHCFEGFGDLDVLTSHRVGQQGGLVELKLANIDSIGPRWIDYGTRDVSYSREFVLINGHVKDAWLIRGERMNLAIDLDTIDLDLHNAEISVDIPNRYSLPEPNANYSHESILCTIEEVRYP